MQPKDRRTVSMDGPEVQQGDVEILRVPDSITINTNHEVKPRNGRLILSEGEVTGHHHAILMRATMFREDGAGSGPPFPNAVVVPHNNALARGAGTARLYRDPAAVEALVRDRKLLREDLAIGFLIVEGGPVTLRHEEHDAIRLGPGRYYVGGQIESVMESAGMDERRVED